MQFLELKSADGFQACGWMHAQRFVRAILRASAYVCK